MGNGKTEYTEEAKRIHAMNKVIAEFDGYRTYSKTYGRNHGIGGGMLDIPKECIIEKLKYHSSFDALMPIVERLESIGEDMLIGTERDANIHFIISKRFCRCVYDWDTYFAAKVGTSEEFQKFEKSSVDYRYSLFDESKILAIHQAVYDCIVWYNKSKEEKQND